MIEDDKLGLKIAENPEEAFWSEVQKKTQEHIKNCEHEIIIQKHIAELATSKLQKI
jgi:hypothetical protein